MRSSEKLWPAQSTSAGANNGTAVDISMYQGVMEIVQNVNTGGTGSVATKIQQGNQSDGSDAADVTGATFTSVTTTGGHQLILLDTRMCGKYIRAVLTVTTGPEVCCVIANGEKKIQ